MHSRDFRQETVATYNRSARQLAAYFRGIGSRHDDINRAFELAGNPHNAKVIEIGCGDGRDAKEIITKTKRYLGFDISEELIRLAREHVPTGQFEVADAVNFDYPPNTDIVFAFASLLHLDQAEAQQVIDKVRTSLRSGGVFYISLKFAPAYQEKLKEDQFGTRLFYFYNPQLIEQLAGEGYKNIYTCQEFIGNTEWFEIALQKI